MDIKSVGASTFNFPAEMEEKLRADGRSEQDIAKLKETFKAKFKETKDQLDANVHDLKSKIRETTGSRADRILAGMEGLSKPDSSVGSGGFSGGSFPRPPKD